MGVILLDRFDADLISGSLRDVVTEQWLAFDGGRSWTGICARRGTLPLSAATIGRTPGKTCKYKDAPEVDDYEAWGTYWQRVVDVGDRMLSVFDPSQPIRVVAEAMLEPEPWQRVGKKQWVPVVGLIGALCGRFSTVYVVKPSKFGSRYTAGAMSDGYHKRLVGGSRRPQSWPKNEHPNKSGQHERSASDVAAFADIQRRATSAEDIPRLLRPEVADAAA